MARKQKENQKEQQQEDMDVLRQILENLVYFSIEEEINIPSKSKDNKKMISNEEKSSKRGFFAYLQDNLLSRKNSVLGNS